MVVHLKGLRKDRGHRNLRGVAALTAADAGRGSVPDGWEESPTGGFGWGLNEDRENATQ